jgi:hypothetical protein
MKKIIFAALLQLYGLFGFSQSVAGETESTEKSDSATTVVTKFVSPDDNYDPPDSLCLYSIPTYDSLGNVHQYRHRFDHVPTTEDTATFLAWVNGEEEKRMAEEEEEKRLHPPPPPVKEKKAVQYAKMRPREGEHLFSLHYISKPNFGRVLIKKLNDSTYSVKGEHRNKQGEYATISGFLTPVTKGELLFEGVIVTRLMNLCRLNVCFKNGRMKFYCKPGRKYWRLQQFDVCPGYDNTAGYYDIFF